LTISNWLINLVIYQAYQPHHLTTKGSHFMRHALTLAIAIFAAQGCGGLDSNPNVARSASELPRFEIRSLKTSANKSEYSTSFTHEGTVVALGDSAATAGTYFVFVSISRVSGGDPDEPREQNDFATVLVRGGVGELRIYGGYRSASEKWEPEKVELRIFGAFPAIEINDTTKYRN